MIITRQKDLVLIVATLFLTSAGQHSRESLRNSNTQVLGSDDDLCLLQVKQQVNNRILEGSFGFGFPESPSLHEAELLQQEQQRLPQDDQPRIPEVHHALSLEGLSLRQQQHDGLPQDDQPGTLGVHRASSSEGLSLMQSPQDGLPRNDQPNVPEMQQPAILDNIVPEYENDAILRLNAATTARSILGKIKQIPILSGASARDAFQDGSSQLSVVSAPNAEDSLSMLDQALKSLMSSTLARSSTDALLVSQLAPEQIPLPISLRVINKDAAQTDSDAILTSPSASAAGHGDTLQALANKSLLEKVEEVASTKEIGSVYAGISDSRLSPTSAHKEIQLPPASITPEEHKLLAQFLPYMLLVAEGLTIILCVCCAGAGYVADYSSDIEDYGDDFSVDIPWYCDLCVDASQCCLGLVARPQILCYMLVFVLVTNLMWQQLCALGVLDEYVHYLLLISFLAIVFCGVSSMICMCAKRKLKTLPGVAEALQMQRNTAMISEFYQAQYGKKFYRTIKKTGQFTEAEVRDIKQHMMNSGSYVREFTDDVTDFIGMTDASSESDVTAKDLWRGLSDRLREGQISHEEFVRRNNENRTAKEKRKIALKTKMQANSKQFNGGSRAASSGGCC